MADEFVKINRKKFKFFLEKLKKIQKWWKNKLHGNKWHKIPDNGNYFKNGRKKFQKWLNNSKK